MSFLLSVNLFEDQWSFINLRDMLLLKKATINEVSAKRKIISHTLTQKKGNLFFIEKQRLFFLNFNQVRNNPRIKIP
jgi:hypothetical protein